MTGMCNIVEWQVRSLLKPRRLAGLGVLLIWGLAWLLRAPLLETSTFSKEVFDRDGRLLRITLSGDEKYRSFVPLSEIPPQIVNAVLGQEDRYFWYHPGVNPLSLFRAVNSTYVAGTKRLGASTITMQLARMRSTRGSKTVVGKIFQIVRALGIESVHGKQEILEAYLNILPYGANIEGIGAASRILFKKSPAQLTPEEISKLVSIPQNPTFNNPSASRAISQLPFAAPHFVNLALDRSRSNREIRLTLNRAIQNLAEKKLRAYVASKRSVGIKNGAVMVLNHETMEVLAQIGSNDFFDDSIGGQINGAAALRSPGSSLKPLVYALALDQGLIHPLSLLKDSPTSFGGFDPENFDQKFMGPLSATDALIHSRNVPAVYLTSLLKNPTLYDFMKSLGIRKLREPEFYGLALSLGAAEVTMEDIVRVYAMLANGGDFKPLRYFLNEKPGPRKAMISAEAAFLTLDMLRDNSRSDQRGTESWIRDAVPTAWKTGTSNGFRDAWTAGVVGPFVIAVWLGNFDNEANPALVGRELASPLLFSIADGLRPLIKAPPQWTSPVGLNVKKVKVCALSGQLPGRHCHVHADTWFIPGKSPISECNIHREILISSGGERACDESRPGLKKQVYEFWPSDLLQLFRAAGIARRTPPPFSRECRLQDTQNAGVPPVIVSPRKDVVYSLRVVPGRNEESEEKIPLSAVSDGDVHALHWFVGSTYLGQSDPSKPIFWKPTPGRHIVRVSDDLGRSDSRSVDVRVTR